MALHWAELATLLLNAGHPPRRRHWSGNGRLHAACAAPTAGSEQERQFSAALQQHFSGQPGVNWVRWNAGTRRVVIDGPAVEAEAAALLERLAALEAQLEGAAAAEERDHPADLEPVLRSLVEMLAELAASLVSSQLAQMALADRSDRTTILAALGSYAGLVAVLRQPALAAAFGCGPLQTTDLVQASLTAALGALAAGARACPSGREPLRL